MANPSSKLILCKGIHLDKNHLNVLDYSEANMLALCQSNAIFSQDDAQFIRETGKITCKCTYAQAKQANYLAFQNPAYSNKWTFAFKDHERYISDSAVEIEFTEDFFSTWFSYLTFCECYVIREHAANDAIGANIVDENINIGEMDLIQNQEQKVKYTSLSALRYCVAVTSLWEDYGEDRYFRGGVYGGVPCSYRIFAFSSAANLQAFCNQFKDEIDKIVGIFTVPDYAIPADQLTNPYTPTPINDDYGKRFTDINLGLANNVLDGYVPRNNKLFTFPYNFCKLVSNTGSSCIYAYEKFSSREFTLIVNVSAGGGQMMYANHYKDKRSLAAIEPRFEENVSINAFPSGSAAGNGLSQWQANNGISAAVSGIAGVAGGAAAIAGGVATFNPALMFGGIVSVGATIGNITQQLNKAGLSANPTVGNSNNMNILQSIGDEGIKFHFEGWCVNDQVAKVIDDYFTKYGYATKEIKIPNISGHYHQNYVQVQGAAVKGDLPGRVADEINAIFNRGVHIWHDHTSIGDF